MENAAATIVLPNELDDRVFDSSYSPLSPLKKPHPPRYDSPFVPKNNSIAQLNRHTGLPHEHKAEIARRNKKK